jgi:hypothetical protein
MVSSVPSQGRGHIPEVPADHIEVALEASCAALMTLESLRARVARPEARAADMDRDLAAATDALRRAIDHLRASSSLSAGLLALGCVFDSLG